MESREVRGQKNGTEAVEREALLKPSAAPRLLDRSMVTWDAAMDFRIIWTLEDISSMKTDNIQGEYCELFLNP